ncbi:uncharacterized protein [Notothenia coriiceps]|uniref:Uncharacterized protein n=1 Tax=Notothenia coriiceps TaxID=8208 RepID=A0A6I9PTA9_9TELE|nr:PREDICTED: uncharacterized protein LOC104963985 [Notothenia coriiceps]
MVSVTMFCFFLSLNLTFWSFFCFLFRVKPFCEKDSGYVSPDGYYPLIISCRMIPRLSRRHRGDHFRVKFGPPEEAEDQDLDVVEMGEQDDKVPFVFATPRGRVATFTEEEDDDDSSLSGTSTRSQPRSAGQQVRIHVGCSKGIEVKPTGCTVGTQTHDDTSTVDAGIQCNLQLNLPERDIIDEEKELEADNSQHEEDNQNDHLYSPSDVESDSSTDEDSDNQDDNDPLRSKLLLLFMSSLMSLFTHCPMCKENSPGRLRRTMGTFVEIDQNCKHCGFQR